MCFARAKVEPDTPGTPGEPPAEEVDNEEDVPEAYDEIAEARAFL